MNNTVWKPRQPQASNMWQFMLFINENFGYSFTNYEDLYAWSIAEPKAFWSELATFFHIQFDTPPHSILNQHDRMLDAKWFEGAKLNFAAQLLRRQDDYPALISVDEQGNRRVLSYRALRQQVAQCAAGLRKAGVGIHDRVGAVMPNTDYTIIAMLATASIGAIWCSCSPDFGVEAIVDRFSQLTPKLLFIGNGHTYQGKVHDATEKIERLNEALPSVKTTIICPIIAPTTSWDAFLEDEPLSFVSTPFDHPVYILFSSGTTGKPKCIMHGAGGTLLQHVKELGLHTDIKTNDNLCFYTTCGWMMWNWMVSTLALGATLTLYEGSPTYPDMTRLFRLIDQEGITIFGTSAKYIATIENADVSARPLYSLRSLRTILSTGSPLLPKHYDYIYQHVKKDVQLSSISGGTDIISCFALGNPLLPVYRGELQSLGLGMRVEVYNEQGQAVREEQGELVCTAPFPSMPIGFWQDPQKLAYQQAYFQRFPGVWAHGDFAEITKRGGLVIYGRSDALLKPGGVRIGTAEIYRQVETIPEVIESIAIGQNWRDDVRIVLFVKLKTDCHLTDALQNTIRKTIRRHASPRHVPAKILEVRDIPRTINGKILETAVRQIVHGQAIQNSQSIANPECLADFQNRKELSTD